MISNQQVNIILIGIIILLVTYIAVSAEGTLDPTTGPGSTTSYSISDLYHRLDSGAAGSEESFSEPGSGPGSSMYDLNDVMSIAPVLDDSGGATAAEVPDGKTFWGLTSSGWGLQEGEKPDRFIVQDPNNTPDDPSDDVVIDTVHNWMWMRNANYYGTPVEWASAVYYCEKLEYAGYNDWFLPDWRFQTLFSNDVPSLPDGHPFLSVQRYYWVNLYAEPPYRTVWDTDYGIPMLVASNPPCLVWCFRDHTAD